MPYASKKQEMYLKKNKPEVAEEFEKDAKQARIKRIVDGLEKKPQGSNQLATQGLTDSMAMPDDDDDLQDNATMETDDPEINDGRPAGEDLSAMESDENGSMADEMAESSEQQEEEDEMGTEMHPAMAKKAQAMKGKLFGGKGIHIFIKSK